MRNHHSLFKFLPILIVFYYSEALAWTGPRLPPPQGNVASPISAENTSVLKILNNLKLGNETTWSSITNGQDSKSGPFIELVGRSWSDQFKGSLRLGSYGADGHIDFLNYNPTTDRWALLGGYDANGNFSASGSARLGAARVTNAIISGGRNSWLIQSPDTGTEKILNIVPGTLDESWDFTKGVSVNGANGNLVASGSVWAKGVNSSGWVNAQALTMNGDNTWGLFSTDGNNSRILAIAPGVDGAAWDFTKGVTIDGASGATKILGPLDIYAGAGSLYEKEGSLCNTGDTIVSYKTTPTYCGANALALCSGVTYCTTGSHDWSADTSVETCSYKAPNGLLSCGVKTCSAKQFVQCKQARSLNVFSVKTNGNVGIGVLNPQSKLEVKGSVKGDEFLLGSGVGFRGNASSQLIITATSTTMNGPVNAPAFLYNSDRNLKQDIRNLEQSASKTIALQGVSFLWKKDGKKSIGFIAQDVEKVYPELVDTDPTTGMKSVNYAGLVAPLVETVKEQQARIDHLERMVQELQERIDK